VAEQEWARAQGLLDKAGQFGLKGPEDFDRYAPVLDQRDLLAQLLAGEAPTEKPEDKPAFDPEQFKQEFYREMAMRELSTAREAEARMLKEFVDSLDGADDAEKELWQLALAGKMESGRAQLGWPDKHPLAGHRLPAYGPDQFKPLTEWARKVRQTLRGAALARIGDAARDQPAATPAGRGGGQGKPDKTERGAEEVSRGIAARAVRKAGFTQ
jgi:hypothetical protein